jgi:predicted peptidase
MKMRKMKTLMYAAVISATAGMVMTGCANGSSSAETTAIVEVTEAASDQAGNAADGENKDRQKMDQNDGDHDQNWNGRHDGNGGPDGNGDRGGNGGPGGNGGRGGNGGPGGNGGHGGGNNLMAEETDPAVIAAINAGKDKFEQLTYDDASGISLEYSFYIPENYDENESWPLIMYIPDSSASGKSAKEIVEQYYGADVWVSDEDQEKHPSFVLVPAFSETVVQDDWSTSDQIEAAMNLIQNIIANYNIDTDRIYTTGQSMGCMTSLYLNSKYPDFFAASMYVSGQWDISVLKNLENQKFFYITAGGDQKASGGQDEVKEMFDNDGVSYSYAEWNAQNSSEEQSAAVEKLLSEGKQANMIRFETGSVLTGNNGMEHMSSFNYGYKLTAVRDWLFQQTK